MKRLLAALLLSIAAATGAEEAPLVDASLVAAIDRCLADAAYQDNYVYDELDGADDEDVDADDDGEETKSFAELCPDVQAGIEASPLGLYLTDDWSDWVPEDKLQRIRALLTAEASDGRRPDTAVVPGIVEKTQAATAAPRRSLWERFKDWLRSLFDKPAQSEDLNWFADWLNEHLPGARTVAVIGYLLLAGIVCAIGWVVYAELRAMGMLSGVSRRRAAAGPAAAAPSEAPTLAGAGDAEAPSILVTLLVGELRRLGRVQDKLSMTHRELGRAARFDAAAEGAAFQDLLGAAERLRYDVTPLPAGALQPVIAAGRRLLESLSRQQSRSAA